MIMPIRSMRLIDGLGRRRLLFWSPDGTTVTLLALSAPFHAGASGQLAWTAVLSVAVAFNHASTT
jgi:hypothetical protein